MSKNQKEAICGHGKARCKGLCRSCYEKQLREKNPDFAERQRENCRNWTKENHSYKNEYGINYRKKNNKEIKRKKYIFHLKQYGLTEEEYNNLLKKQDGKCLICGRKQDERKRLSVDHCHKTNWIRGLLCFRCNFGMGWFAENIEIFERIIKYLKGEYGFFKKIDKPENLRKRNADSKRVHIGFRKENINE